MYARRAGGNAAIGAGVADPLPTQNKCESGNTASLGGHWASRVFVGSARAERWAPLRGWAYGASWSGEVAVRVARFSIKLFAAELP